MNKTEITSGNPQTFKCLKMKNAPLGVAQPGGHTYEFQDFQPQVLKAL